jgi:hypothetical protein
MNYEFEESTESILVFSFQFSVFSFQFLVFSFQFLVFIIYFCKVIFKKYQP